MNKLGLSKGTNDELNNLKKLLNLYQEYIDCGPETHVPLLRTLILVPFGTSAAQVLLPFGTVVIFFTGWYAFYYLCYFCCFLAPSYLGESMYSALRKLY